MNINEIEGYCCGCGLCIALCPMSAISIKINTFGFYSAIIDNELCINCGRCVEKCYKTIGAKQESLYHAVLLKSTVYASKSKDSYILHNSSSGGIAHELSKYLLSEGYTVCGCTYDVINSTANHIFIESEEDLYNISGSKYIQSNFSGVIKETLANRKKEKIAYFGTPCQIYAIRNLLTPSEQKNKVFIDLFCHGTNSYYLWWKYIKEIKKISNINVIQKVSFRDKKLGWSTFAITIEGNSMSFTDCVPQNLFYKFFLDNLCLNQCCYNCKLRFDYCYSDIRLGDFWGNQYMDDKKGVSLVALINEKGELLFNKIIGRIEIKKHTVDDLLKSQRFRTFPKPVNYESIISGLKEEKSLANLFKKYRNIIPINIKLSIYVKSNTYKLLLKILPRKYSEQLKEYRIRRDQQLINNLRKEIIEGREV